MLHKILLAFTLIYFFIFGTLMAHTSGQPDQAPHGYYSRRFTETWGIPEEDPTIRYTVTGQPYLYYWINGAVYKIANLFLSTDQINATLLWRMMSVFMGTFTVFYTYELAKKVTGNPFGGILAAFFLSNTLMFAFMSGGISYDNLMYLASTASIYHIVCLYKKQDFIRHTALAGIWVVIGALAKEQFLLLTLILFLTWIYILIRDFRNINISFSKSNILFFCIFLFFFVLFLGLYGQNLLRYGKPTPSCSQFKDLDICTTYSYRNEFYQPLNLQWLWFSRDDISNPIKYGLTYWGYKMSQSTWGILSHNTFIPELIISLHLALVFMGFLPLLRCPKKKFRISILLIFILLSYSGYVLLWNYMTEIKYSFQHYGVTGRYLLPILSTFLTILTFSFFRIKNSLFKRITIITAIIIYFYGGLGLFISRYATIFSHWRIYY